MVYDKNSEFKEFLEKNQVMREQGCFVLCLNQKEHEDAKVEFVRCPSCQKDKYTVCGLCKEEIKERWVCDICQYRGKKAKIQTTLESTPENIQAEETIETSDKGAKPKDFSELLSVYSIKSCARTQRDKFLSKYLKGSVLCDCSKICICPEIKAYQCPLCNEYEEHKICEYSLDVIRDNFVCGSCKYNELSEIGKSVSLERRFRKITKDNLWVLWALVLAFTICIPFMSTEFKRNGREISPTKDDRLVSVGEGIWRQDFKDKSEFIFLMERNECESLVKDVSVYRYIKDSNPCEVLVPAEMANRVEALIKKVTSHKSYPESVKFLGSVEKSFNIKGDTHRHYRIDENVDKIASLKTIEELTKKVSDIEVIDIRYFRVLKSKENAVDDFLRVKKFDIVAKPF